MSLSKRIFYNLNVTGGSLLSNDMNIGSGTVSNIYLGNISGGSMTLSGNLSVGGTLTTVNITTNNISETNVSASSVVATNVNITNLSTGSVIVSGNTTFGSNVLVAGPVLQIPTGNISSRPNTPASGYIRYNTETSQFEGYGPGNAWGSLGGVVDIAQTTKILASATPSVTDGNLYFYTVGSERVRINSAGNIGIGTTSPSGLLHLNNSALFTSSGDLTCIGDITAFGSISDRRFKENITNIPLDVALDKVKNLRPVTFTWKDTIQNEVKRGTTDAGFIAQEVEEVVEYAVGEFDDIVTGERYKKLNHERITPYLVAALQEMDGRLQQESLLYQKTISNLQDTISNLQDTILDLQVAILDTKQKLINLTNTVSELVEKE